MPRSKKPGVLCLEGYWPDKRAYNNTKRALLRINRTLGVPFIHRDTLTLSQFFTHLEKWLSPQMNDYPILFLSFHGKNGRVQIGDEPVTLSKIASWLCGRANGRGIHFSSCQTLAIPKSELDQIMDQSGLYWISGYTADVPIDHIHKKDFEFLARAVRRFAAKEVV